jgi:hypothetical protein
MLKSRFLLISLSVLILVGGFVPQSFSQEKLTKPMNKVTLRVTAPNGTWAIASVVEGETLTFVDEKTGAGFAFVPTVLDAKSRNVEVKVFQITQGKTVEKAVESLSGEIGSSRETNSSFKIEFKAIAKNLPDENGGVAIFRQASYVATSASAAVAPQCCLNCGGFRICSNCFVITDCGCCCTGQPASCCDDCK